MSGTGSGRMTGLTVEAPEHPKASVTVTLTGVAVETLMLELVAPVDQV